MLCCKMPFVQGQRLERRQNDCVQVGLRCDIPINPSPTINTKFCTKFNTKKKIYSQHILTPNLTISHQIFGVMVCPLETIFTIFFAVLVIWCALWRWPFELFDEATLGKLAMLVWYIWCARNDLIWNSKSFNTNMIIRLTQGWLEAWQELTTRKNSTKRDEAGRMKWNAPNCLRS